MTLSNPRPTHIGMAALVDEPLWMYITSTDEARDAAHKNITKIKYISVQQQNLLPYIF